MTAANGKDAAVEFLTVGEGADARGIAMLLEPPAAGNALAHLVWLGGYRSDMTGTKAVELAALAARLGTACVRFDYSGHGASGGAFVDGTISRWLEEALAVIDHAARALTAASTASPPIHAQADRTCSQSSATLTVRSPQSARWPVSAVVSATTPASASAASRGPRRGRAARNAIATMLAARSSQMRPKCVRCTTVGSPVATAAHADQNA